VSSWKPPGSACLPSATGTERCCRTVRRYHEKQLAHSWSYEDEDGTLLGQQVTALDRVGIYVPGGKAAYPSSVLMNAMPAKVAGVGEIIMVVPTPQGERNDLVLAAAFIAGVDKVFTCGGAQAVAALAYGTETIPQVDKITGPGNAYVAAAKRRVFGVVGIDMVAGPSEILVICDGNTPADWIAMDLFSQAEHDEIAQAILLCPSAEYIAEVEASIEKLLPTMPRRAIIEASLGNRGALIQVRDLAEACEIANYIAPEHLELSVSEPDSSCRCCATPVPSSWAVSPRKAWATTVPAPTTCCPPAAPPALPARWGVRLPEALQPDSRVCRRRAKLGKIASVLAHGEGLTAHARAAELRLES
jgi:histidinol dehydrogenase